MNDDNQKIKQDDAQTTPVLEAIPANEESQVAEKAPVENNDVTLSPAESGINSAKQSNPEEIAASSDSVETPRNDTGKVVDDRKIEDSILKMEDSKVEEKVDPLSSTIEEPSSIVDLPPSEPVIPDVPGSRWYVVHTYSGHENRVAAALKQRIESEHLENKILDVLVPTQEKIEIRGGKKENVKEKIFPGYILVRMVLDDISWLAVRTTQGVTSFVGMSNKPTAIPDSEVKSIVSYMTQGAQPTYKTTFAENDTVKIIDGPFAEFIGKVESVDKERGKIKVLVSIFGRETPVELDFLQVAKL